MTDRGLRLLGLGLAAGSVIVGTGAVRRALQQNGVDLVVLAGDYSPRTAEKVVRLAVRRGVMTLVGPAAGELGRRVGRETVQAIGIRDRALARGMVQAEGTKGSEGSEED